MATFINKKEEVIKIELTSYGRGLLAKGRLKPAYYAFFDDEVYYDSRYAGVTASASEIVDRIENNTHLLNPIPNRYSIETTYRRDIGQYDEDEVTSGALPAPFEQHVYANSPLGASALTSQDAPAWSINTLDGINDAQTIATYFTSSQKIINIPQIEVTGTYKLKVKDAAEAIQNPTDFADESFYLQADQTSRFSDNTVITVKQQNLLLDVLENNTAFLAENFDIEVFTVDTDSDGEETLTRLNFKKEFKSVEDGILKDSVDTVDIEIDSTFVEYYFDVEVDDDIDLNVFCDKIKNLKKETRYLNQRRKCETVEDAPVRLDIYGRVIGDTEVC